MTGGHDTTGGIDLVFPGLSSELVLGKREELEIGSDGGIGRSESEATKGSSEGRAGGTKQEVSRQGHGDGDGERQAQSGAAAMAETLKQAEAGRKEGNFEEKTMNFLLM